MSESSRESASRSAGSDFNLPNAITATRIAVAPLIAYLPFVDSPTWRAVAFGLYVAAAISDYVDGVLARSDLQPRAGRITRGCLQQPDRVRARQARHKHRRDQRAHLIQADAPGFGVGITSFGAQGVQVRGAQLDCHIVESRDALLVRQSHQREKGERGRTITGRIAVDEGLRLLKLGRIVRRIGHGCLGVGGGVAGFFRVDFFVESLGTRAVSDFTSAYAPMA